MFDVKPGDKLIRMLAGTIPMTMMVTKVEGGVLTCAPEDVPDLDAYEFDQVTGYEIDDRFPGVIVSFLKPEKDN